MRSTPDETPHERGRPGVRKLAALTCLAMAAGVLTVAGTAVGGPRIERRAPLPNFSTLIATVRVDVSPDGRFVVLPSKAADLVPGQINQDLAHNPPFDIDDIFLVDRLMNVVTLVSHRWDSPITTGNGGQPGGPVGSDTPLVSADGRFVSFESGSTDLIQNQSQDPLNSGRLDVFLFDANAGTITLVTHAAGSTTAGGNGTSSNSTMSADGRFVSFFSRATNLGGGITKMNAGFDIFLFDRTGDANTPARTITLVSHAAGSPTTGGNGSSAGTKISQDGRFVAFLSLATDLVQGGITKLNGAGDLDIFLFDRTGDANTPAGTITLVSHAVGSPTTTGNGASGVWEMSPDGRFVAFTSTATNLLSGGTTKSNPGSDDVFLFDRTGDANTPAGTITLVSRAAGSSTTTGNGQSEFAQVSADGRYVAYHSTATNLVAGMTKMNAGSDVFLFDRVGGTTTLVSHAAGLPTTTGIGTSDRLGISADGRFVVYRSLATNLVSGQVDGNANFDVFLFDRQTGTNALVSGAGVSSTVTGNGPTSVGPNGPEISADGRVVVFISSASDLVTGDVNGNYDVFAFVQSGPTLTVMVAGGGTVTSQPPGVNCPPDCSDPYPSGTVVTLTATAAPSFVFAGWSGGGCTGTDLCMVTLTADTGVSANFVGPSRLTVIQPLNGVVVSLPPGISCPPVCDALFPNGATVTLIPIGLSGVFTGFSGNADCLDLVVVVTADVTCTASFIALDVRVVSGNPTTGSPGNFESLNPAVSGDGRFVVFESLATNLDPACSSGTFRQIFVRDRTLNTVRCVSVGPALGPPGLPGNNDSTLPAISANGRFVAFESLATNLQSLGAPCTSGVRQVFLHDRQLNATSCVSVAINGAAGTVASGQPSLSGDGQVVAFQSGAPNLAPECANGVRQIIVVRRTATTRTVRCASVGVSGQAGNFESSEPVVSGNAQVIAFQSSATNLVTSGCITPGVPQVFVREGDATACISRAPDGSPGDGASGRPDLSDDGTKVVFESTASNLATACATAHSQIFLLDRSAGTVRCVSVGPAGIPGDGPSVRPAISGDGSVVVFVSTAVNLARGLPLTSALDVHAVTCGAGGNTFRVDTVLNNVSVLISGSPSAGGPAVNRDGGLTVAERCDGGLPEVVTATPDPTPPPDDNDDDHDGQPDPDPNARPVIVTPLTATIVAVGGQVTFAWRSIPGAAGYGLEYTGLNLGFINPNGTGPDSVNGYPNPPGQGGGFPVGGTTTLLTVPLGTAHGNYQLRVIGLTTTNQPVGRFSDAVTLIVGTVPISPNARPVITSPPNNASIGRGQPVTVIWEVVPGVGQYLVEFTGPNRVFANPNGTAPDPGNLATNQARTGGTALETTVPTVIPPGPYQVRVISLDGAGNPAGTFSDSVTIIVTP